MSNRLRWILTALIVVAALVLGALGYLTQEPEAIIQWSTESEVETAGFHVYRSVGEEGAWERVSDSLIPSAGDPFSGAEYEFRDQGIAPGQTYYYQLEELETSGTFTRLPDTVRFDTQREPLFTLSYLNWLAATLLVGALLVVWLLPGPPRPRPSEGYEGIEASR